MFLILILEQINYFFLELYLNLIHCSIFMHVHYVIYFSYTIVYIYSINIDNKFLTSSKINILLWLLQILIIFIKKIKTNHYNVLRLRNANNQINHRIFEQCLCKCHYHTEIHLFHNLNNLVRRNHQDNHAAYCISNFYLCIHDRGIGTRCRDNYLTLTNFDFSILF